MRKKAVRLVLECTATNASEDSRDSESQRKKQEKKKTRKGLATTQKTTAP